VTKSLFVGVSGFSYPGWKGSFYPKDLKSEEFLSFYSKKLNSVEINSSFYAPPSSAMIESWSSKTQDSFKFSMKAPRQITHILKLGNGAAASAQRLDGTLELLGPKRGPVLFQLPPFLRQDLKLLETFLGETSKFKQRVFEFRHDSWMNDSTYKLLEKNEIGFCIAETEDMKPVLKVIGDISYYRLRNERYDDKSIDVWSKQISELSKDSKEVYVYLRHDETGDNASAALRLMVRVAGKS
jgi:uncharacterized protein YecE (DUF72 family)